MLIIKRFLSLLSCSARNIRTRAAAIQEQKTKRDDGEDKKGTQEKCGEEQIKLYFADWIEVDYHSRWLWPLNDTIRIDRTLFSHSNIFEFLPLLYLLLMWCRWFIASMFRFPFFLLTHFQFSLRCTCQDSFTFYRRFNAPSPQSSLLRYPSHAFEILRYWASSMTIRINVYK